MRIAFLPCCTRITRIRVLLFFVIALMSVSAWSQKKQLHPSGKITRIAWIDPKLLHKNYTEYKNLRDSLAAANTADKNVLQKSLQDLDQQTATLLRQDSVTGSQNRQQILSNANAKRSQLITNFQFRQKTRNDFRVSANQDYERRIVLAVESVQNEGGFTEIRPLEMATKTDNVVDVTSLVLKKLNRN